MRQITSTASEHLYDIASTRAMETRAAADLPPHTLMRRAGSAVARLTLALAPHARHIWIACGPGNNGGDGFEAAFHLQQAGKKVTVTRTSQKQLPPDAQKSLDRAVYAGVAFVDTAAGEGDFDFCIDALLGIGGLGASRPEGQIMTACVSLVRSTSAPVLAVDLPSGLNADTGADTFAGHTNSGEHAQRFTLSLLTLKPGLFTAMGRDLAGDIWFDDLNVGASAGDKPVAVLLGADEHSAITRPARSHASHKGSFGDVAVVGGETTDAGSMAGAALLAASAALHSGAGRVMVALLGKPPVQLSTEQPELMFRHLDALDLKHEVLVCGCGGGQAVRAVLPRLLSTAARAVFDADALNAIAGDSSLQALLAARASRAYQTVVTPHPLEAARLLACTASDVQADRRAAASQLSEKFKCTVVLKGSGTVIASPGGIPAINPTGNGLLATAGTGDVLAGMIGSLMAQGDDALAAARCAVFMHGEFADRWVLNHSGSPLTAGTLARLNL